MTSAVFDAAVAICILGLVWAIRDGVEWRRARSLARRGRWGTAGELQVRSLSWPLLPALMCMGAAGVRVWELNAELATVPGALNKIEFHRITRASMQLTWLSELVILLVAGGLALCVMIFVGAQRKTLRRVAEHQAERSAWAAEERQLFLVPMGAFIATSAIAHNAHAAIDNVRPWSQPLLRAEILAHLGAKAAREATFETTAQIATGVAVLGILMCVWGLRRELVDMPALPFAALAVGGLLVAGGLHWHVGRLAEENASAIPTKYAFANASLGFPTARGIEAHGPDAFEEGPYVLLTASETSVNGSAVESDEHLRGRLQLSTDSSDAAINIDLAPALRFDILRERLALFATYRYARANLGLSDTHTRNTPLLGELTGVRRTAVTAALATTRAACPTGTIPRPLLPAVYLAIDPLIDELLHMRHQGERPCLVTGLPICGATTVSDECLALLEGAVEVIARVEVPRIGEALRFRSAGVEFDLVVASEPDTVQVHDGRGATLLATKAELERAGRVPVMLMNAGMFHPGYAPVGLLVHEGDRRNPLDASTSGDGNFYLLPNGVFSVGLWDHHLDISPSNPGLDLGLAEATQSGPLLLHDGRLHAKVRANSQSRVVRNGVGMLDDSTAVFIMSRSPVTFYELAKALLAMGCRDALYLDGAISEAWIPALNVQPQGGRLGPVVSVSRPPASR